MRSGVRWAETTFASYSMPRLERSSPAGLSVGQSDWLPIMRPTAGMLPAILCRAGPRPATEKRRIIESEIAGERLEFHGAAYLQGSLSKGSRGATDMIFWRPRARSPKSLSAVLRDFSILPQRGGSSRNDIRQQLVFDLGDLVLEQQLLFLEARELQLVA